ncbi:hypothetical protein [Streptomyces wuyuanensis]
MTLLISVYAPCALVPDGFAVYDWAEADWHPQDHTTRGHRGDNV